MSEDYVASMAASACRPPRQCTRFSQFNQSVNINLVLSSQLGLAKLSSVHSGFVQNPYIGDDDDDDYNDYNDDINHNSGPS